MKRFLSRFWSGLEEYSRPSERGPLNPISTLARFLTARGQFSSERVKEAAFLPRLEDGVLVLSTFRIDGLSESEVHALGKKHRSEKYKGSGVFSATARPLAEGRIKLDPDNVPDRHVSVVGWPEEKGEQKLIAQAMAAECALRSPV